ncbi:GNAT family N-acetyltransferase [Photobacterium galatheae]|uniref:GCN5 family acetyltransferase n=1 Tax=Photobacterium galatheae TaxID=1654360 RepID=A0A066S1J8_9GAMM|nr:GNAT family N-acetyltransferase [Photobacterium galatheae]KDM93518.1 GCN5 family acetyltransferase [Photobacterium galatheae]MCM0151342.1 GNAT family N-acetyltransferase [Photobacterium galatheae]
MIRIRHVDPALIPMALLLEADPSEACIQHYLNGAFCLAAVQEDEIIGVCVTQPIAEQTYEVFNLAVFPAYQQQGIGRQLLAALFPRLKKQGVTTLVLGTGTFGYQLTFYQKLGFRVDSVVKDFFVEHYDEPIVEQGLQHLDMLRLRLDLTAIPG